VFVGDVLVGGVEGGAEEGGELGEWDAAWLASVVFSLREKNSSVGARGLQLCVRHSENGCL
jgi:hypothetical protein